MRTFTALLGIALACAPQAPGDAFRGVGAGLPAGSPPTATVFADDFESGFTPAQNGAAGWQPPGAHNVNVSTDVAHSGTHSLRFTFRGKAHCEDSTAEQRFWLGRPMQEVWLEFYVYYPAGGEGGSARYEHRWEFGSCSPADSPDNNKFLAMFGPVYPKAPTVLIQTWSTTLALSVPPRSPGDSRVQASYTRATEGGVIMNASNYPDFITGADRGRWLQIRFHLRVADFAQNDGIIQMWKDGRLILNDRGLPWFDASGKNNYLTQGYLLGWANSGFTQTTNIYIDDLSILDQNPGW